MPIEKLPSPYFSHNPTMVVTSGCMSYYSSLTMVSILICHG